MTPMDVWHASNEAVARGDWDQVGGYLAADCVWTLMPPGRTFHGRAEIVGFLQGGWVAAASREGTEVRNEFATDEWGVFEYTSRGTIDADRAARFGSLIGVDAAKLVGASFEVPVCFVYHVNGGEIDRVNEYAAAGPPSAS